MAQSGRITVLLLHFPMITLRIQLQIVFMLLIMNLQHPLLLPQHFPMITLILQQQQFNRWAAEAYRRACSAPGCCSAGRQALIGAASKRTSSTNWVSECSRGEFLLRSLAEWIASAGRSFFGKLSLHFEAVVFRWGAWFHVVDVYLVKLTDGMLFFYVMFFTLWRPLRISAIIFRFGSRRGIWTI